MKNNSLIIYPNCSMGGMATVYRTRILSNPQINFTLLFVNDLGGKSFFEDLANVEVVIVRKDRLLAYASFLAESGVFANVFVTSLPEVANRIARVSGLELIYEFHSSSAMIIEKELNQLQIDDVSSIQVPSNYLLEIVAGYLDHDYHHSLKVVPNLTDGSIFRQRDDIDFEMNLDGRRPLVWIGRLDSGKNVADFLRLLSIVDDQYIGIIILGLEQDPSRFANFLGYASSLGVKSRIRVFVNLPQAGIADLYNLARLNDGFFVSTSLGESFGYGVQEALDCGLNTLAYDVGALAERTFRHESVRYSLVDVGAIASMANRILNSRNS